MRGLLLLTAWTLLGVVYGPARSATVSPRAVSSTAELRDALMSPSVDMVWVNNTLDINKAEWGATLAINRSVTVSVTPERLATSTYVRVNFNEASMLFQLLPGTTLTFIGLEVRAQLRTDPLRWTAGTLQEPALRTVRQKQCPPITTCTPDYRTRVCVPSLLLSRAIQVHMITFSSGVVLLSNPRPFHA